MNQTRDGDATLNDATLKEQPATLLNGAPDGEAQRGPGVELGTFRGWPVLEQLATKGAEADIYIVQVGDERRILKLYRHRLEPKLEVLNRVTELSQKYSRHFVLFFEAGFDEFTGRWYELQEYMSLGSLRDIFQTAKHDAVFIKKLVINISEAIQCLHVNGIVHCDIKPPNILVRSLDPPNLVLTDFGISSVLASDASKKMTGLKGTPMYWAPEAFSREIGRPCDWWGLGMIVLELLAGEHPFEGMTDSQIIRELTVGNVKIPNLDPEWSILVKGLLTKNDAKRWGYGEVTRWLAGARDIPVHYEEAVSSFEKVSPGITPFRFEGREYFTEEELARAFAESETAWMHSSSYLGYIRRWFESNMMFDEAARLGSDISDPIPERGLFRFVHTNAKLPFTLFGKLIDQGSLEVLLRRTANGEASGAEGRVAEMLADGQIASFYDEYVKISGTPREPFFYNLLLFMDKKELHEQLECFNAMRDPEAYIWPEGVKGANEVEILDDMRMLGVVPLRRSYLEAIACERILPHELLFMLKKTGAYAKAASLLRRWNKEGLLLLIDIQPIDYDLIPRYGLLQSFTSLIRKLRQVFAMLKKNRRSANYERLSLCEYERVARERNWGHVKAALENIDFIVGTLSDLPSPKESHDAQNREFVIERIRKLKEAKITPTDSLFMLKITKLLEQRKSEEHSWIVDAFVPRRRGPVFSVSHRTKELVENLYTLDKKIAEACATYLSQIPPN